MHSGLLSAGDGASAGWPGGGPAAAFPASLSHVIPHARVASACAKKPAHRAAQEKRPPGAHRDRPARRAGRRRLPGVARVRAGDRAGTDRIRLRGHRRSPEHPARHRAGVHRGHHRRRGPPAGDAAGGGHHRVRDRDAGVQAAQPELRRPGLGRRLPAAAFRGLGPAEGSGGPDLRQHQVLPRAQGHPRLPEDARVPGGAGGAAQRGRGGLHPVREDGRGHDPGVHRAARARGLLLVRLGQPRHRPT